MGTISQAGMRKNKIAVMALLLALSCGLTYHFHAKLNLGIVFTHFFYVPIILACIWWRRWGVAIAVFLAAVLIASHHAFRPAPVGINNYFRAAMLVGISIVVAVLSERIASRQERIEHLNAVLRAIRNVNQLIAREKDRGRLLQGACDNFIETRGYHNAWIAVLDEAGRLVATAESGLGTHFSPMVERIRQGKLPHCAGKALKQSGVVVTADPSSECTDCPLSTEYAGSSGMTVRLKHGNTLYGLLAASIPAGFAEDVQEQALLKEVAGDIAFALQNIELTEQRERAEEALRESERRLWLIMENTSDGINIAEYDPRTHRRRLVMCNERYVEMSGYSREELMATDNLNRFAREIECYSRPFHEQTLKSLPSTGMSSWTRPDGKENYYEWTATPLKVGDKYHIIGIDRDITEHRRAEEAIRKSEERLRAIFAAAENVSIITTDLAGTEAHITDFSPGAEHVFGYKRDEIIGKPLAMLHRPQDAAYFPKVIDTIGRTKAGLSQETTLVRKNGEEFPALLSVHPIFNAEGKMVSVLGVSIDITNRKRAEEALQESQRHLATMAANIPGVLFRVVIHRDGSLSVPYVSPSARRFGAYGPEEMTARPELVLEVIHPDDREHFKDAVAASSKNPEPIDWELRLNPPFVKAKWIRVIARPQAMPADEVVWDGVALDITERKQAEESLRESEEQYRAIFESSTDALFIFDLDGNIVEANPAACAAYGYSHEEIVGLSGRDIVHPERYHLFEHFNEQVKTTGQFFTGSVDVRKDGSVFDVEIRGTTITFKGRPHLMAVVRDITERKRAEQDRQRLEEQLRQAVKMEAVGRLAGGIAHDFNNMLAIIQGYADLLIKSTGKDDKRLADVESIRTAARRAAALTRQLLAFGRRQTIQPRVLQLNEVIADVDSMLQRTIGEDVKLVAIPSKGLWHVKADPMQVEQVILNLAVNAREAMPKGGKLTIETANVTLDEDYARRHAEVKPGEYVMLAVSDTGVGMSKEVMSHIFEPFFTTKEMGKGTGLGLSTTYGIVKQSGGYIWAHSEPGHGTTFRIYLPRVAEPTEPLVQRYEPARLPRGTETVLVVEDEPKMQALTCRVLREQGYTVLDAGGGEEALSIAAEQAGGEIHLLITDVVMPQMSGKELADRLKDLQPNIKVLFTSGYTDNIIVHHGVLDEGVNYLAKPFPAHQLIETVRRVLDAG